MSDVLYRVLLVALPRSLRRAIGEDMVQLFRDQRRDVGPHPVGHLRLWLAAIADVVIEGARERASHRVARHFSWKSIMRTVIADIRSGLRLLRRYPTTSCLAVATLALGLGANSAIFSVVDAVLLRQLPYPEPDRLAMVWEKRPREGAKTNVVSPADYLDWRRMNSSFEHMAAYLEMSVSLTGAGDPVQIPAAAVGGSFFDVLGVRPALGGTFSETNEIPGQGYVVVLSHRLWQSRFASDSDLIGKTITLNNRNIWRVVGVLPADFQFIDPTIQVWMPLGLEGGSSPPSRVSHGLQVYARLKPNVTMAQAGLAMEAIGAELERQYPVENRGHGANVVPMRDIYVKDVRVSLMVIFAAVGLVLLIACVNVANLLLARAVSRRREMAVRAALGASRGRLILQTLVESLTLAAAGGILGLGVARLILAALPVVMPERLSLIGLDEIHLDPRVFAFAVALTIATGLVFGLLPALHASGAAPSEALAIGGRTAGGVRRRARLALVIGEVALATLTLVGAGLVIRSFAAMLAQPLGFEPDHRLTLFLSITPSRYPSIEQRLQVMSDLEARLGTLPGVTSVGGINLLPMSGGESRTSIAIEGREVKPEDPPIRMHPRTVTPSYFRALGIPIVSGRGFTSQDDAASGPVAIISATSAKRFWPGGDPIGVRIHYGGDETWRRIVGIAADVRHWGLNNDINPMIYTPQAQTPSTFLTFVLKTDRDIDPASIARAARAGVSAIDRELPVPPIRTMDDIVAKSLAATRAQTVLMSAFGALALLLAVIGIYGVTAQLVTARIREIAVRMALGARPINIVRQLLGEGLAQTLIGVGLGLVAGAYLMRLAAVGQAMLYHVEAWDPLTLAGVTVVLIGAALAACLIPARRAMRVNPVEALKEV
jgi:putative ABC transport system permease protein